MDTIASLYPPAPRDVPPDLRTPGASYRARVLLVLASLIAFMLFYVALVVASGYLFYWALTYPLERPTKGPVLLKLGLIGMTALLFLFLLKSFFKRYPTEKPELLVEVTERDQPTLFAFIRRVCRETGAPFPHR